MNPPPLDHSRLRVFPLSQRRSLASLDEILVSPEAEPPPCEEPVAAQIAGCAARIRQARKDQASVLLIYGAHLVKNGAGLLLEKLMASGWVTHLATNGAGVIHDWEFAFQGRSTESVRENVATGTFGAWDETGRAIHLAVLAGNARGEGFGRALGRFVHEDGTVLPEPEALERELAAAPAQALGPAQCDLLRAMKAHGLQPGRQTFKHPWKSSSILANAFRRNIPLTVHPGIGYDIISNHPMFNGAALGRAAELDFKSFGGSVERLDGGVVLSIGSAIMGPQVFEKSLSCVNNLRRQAGRPIVNGHSIYVVDLQEGGAWSWAQGEPPVTHPAYYLRFCKSYSRMGGEMQYVCCDNVLFVHRLFDYLLKK